MFGDRDVKKLREELVGSNRRCEAHRLELQRWERFDVEGRAQQGPSHHRSSRDIDHAKELALWNRARSAGQREVLVPNQQVP